MALFKKKEKGKEVEKKKPVEGEMGFLEHLEELRWHVVKSIVAIVFFGIIAFIYHDKVFNLVIEGPAKEWFPTFRFLCSISERMCFHPPELEIIRIALAETFLAAISVSFWIGFIVAFPYIFYQFWTFVKPGLYEKERKAARGMVTICSLLFIIGVSFGYFGITPFAIKFLASFDLGMNMQNTVSIKSLIGYIVMITIPAGIVFELPIVIFFLAKIGLVSSGFLKKYRKHAYVLILIISAIITPPDMTTQIMIGIPVFGLYEIGIYIARRVEADKKKELAKT